MTLKAHSSLFAALRWLGGPLVWAVQFLVVYASESLICRNANAQMHEFLVLAATVIAITVLIILIAYGLRRPKVAVLPGDAFMGSVGIGVALLGLLGVAWTGVVGMILPSCTS